MTSIEAANYWLEQVKDPRLHQELEELVATGSNEQINDAFYQELSFGTAGLRGIIGPGTNRMNIYTVGRATQGLADYLNSQVVDRRPRVAIARDSRHMGEEFVNHAASVLAGNGIEVFLYPRIEPTPALSFAVRDLHADAGICMTASHNPAPYNGYKVYGSDGCQITSQAADDISGRIQSTDLFAGVSTLAIDDAREQGLVNWIEEDTLDRFIEAVLACRLDSGESADKGLELVYTPLCGTGLECMQRTLKEIGIDKLHLVEAQASPDGDFPTCEYPNPEERKALEEGIAVCEKHQADLLLATDPDADRVGTAVLHEGAYLLPTGNEMGILLLDYICKMRSELDAMPENPIAVSTIVSTAMIDAIAQTYGVEIKRTLTGFKYIGEIISELEAEGEQDRFIFGFEESYGYLSGTHVRDKDAINAGMLICQMAHYYKQRGMDLIDALGKLYERYGFYQNRTVNIAFPGEEGAHQMGRLMERLRANPPRQCAQRSVEEVLDYKEGIGKLPKADVVEYRLEDNLKLIFRPSGTEPKLKLYLFSHASTAQECQDLLDTLEQAGRELTQTA